MVEPLPTKIPIWNTGGSNRTEPLTGEKTSGWAVDDEPPSSYFNWLQYYTGAWLTWLSERITKGTLEHDLIVSALPPAASGDGGDLTLSGADANTSGDGGVVVINGGDAAGSNSGGDVDINGGDGDSGAGDVSITGGDAATTGRGGIITVTAGAGGDGWEGGDIDVKAGASTNANAGDVTIEGGDSSGTDRAAGEVGIKTGESTGTAAGLIALSVAESESGGSGSGSYTNAPVEYLRLLGASGAKHVRSERFLVVDNPTSVDPLRGQAKLFPKAEPTNPSEGDLYPDEDMHQLAFHNGTRYHNLNPIVWNNSDFAITGLTPAAPLVNTTYALQQLPYGSPGPPVGSAFRITIPANKLRAGAIVRVRAYFALSDTGGGLSPYPHPKVFVGYVSGGPPYSTPAGVQIFAPTRSNALSWDRCSVECELAVRDLGPTGNMDRRWMAGFVDSAGGLPMNDNQAVYNTDVLNTGTALDVFPAAQYFTSVAWDIHCTSFLVEIF